MAVVPKCNYGVCCGGPYNAKHLAHQSDTFAVAVDKHDHKKVYAAQVGVTPDRPCDFYDYIFDEPSKTWIWDDSSRRDTLLAVDNETRT